MDSDIICGECNVTFSKRKNLYAHMRKFHDIDPVSSKIKKDICDVCGQGFINKSNLSRHIRQIHKISSSNIDCKRSFRIICPMNECSDCFRNYDGLRKHLTTTHAIKFEIDDFKFESCSAFHEWKDQIQAGTLSIYVLHTSLILLKDGSKKKFYNCHRSYNYIHKGKNVRSLKGTGTNKIGKACPSRMEVVFKSNGSVNVKFWKTHLGHSCDIGRIFLGKETRAEIAGKMKEGVTFEHILNEIQDGGITREEFQRILLLEKKDLHNIARDFHIGYSTKHPNDAISIKLWEQGMNKLQDESSGLLYKEQSLESGVIKLNICKDIHACSSFFVNNCDKLDEGHFENNSAVGDILSNIHKSSEVSINKLDDIKKKAEMVIGLCDTSLLTNEEYRSVVNSFDKILDVMNKKKAIHFHETIKINSNEKVEKPIHLFSTKKKKIKGVSKFRKPTVLEQKSMIEGLLAKSDSNINIHTGFDHTYNMSYAD